MTFKEIQYNPFRVLGLYADASLKEIKSRLGDIAAYQKVSKPIHFPSEFSFLENIDRTKELIRESESKLNLDNDKMQAALFWFVDSTHIESLALGYLSEGNDEKAVQIWKEAVSLRNPSKSTYGSYNNYSTYLLENLERSLNRVEDLKLALELKSNLVWSDAFSFFITEILNDKAVGKSKIFAKDYFDLLVKELKVHRFYTNQSIISLFERCDSRVTKDLKTTQVNQLYTRIMSSLKNYELQSGKHLSYLNELAKFKRTIPSLLDQLRSIVDSKDIKYQNASDKYADTIIQICIDYLSSVEPPTENILKNIKEILANNEKWITKQKTKQHLINLRSSVDNMERNLPYLAIQVELIELKDAFEDLEFYENPSAQSALEFFNETYGPLQKVSQQLGPSDNLVVRYSSEIAYAVIGFSVNGINTIMKEIQYDGRMGIGATPFLLENLEEQISISLKLYASLESYSLNSEARASLNKNFKDLRGIHASLGGARGGRSRSTQGSSRKSGKGLFGFIKKYFG